MKAAFMTRCDGPEVLEIRDIPIPEAGSDLALVRVGHGTPKSTDIVRRLEVCPETKYPPYIPGLAFSGDAVRMEA